MIKKSLCAVSVCLSARICQKPHVQISTNFLNMLLVTVADGTALRYVLPVLCMTSYFHVIEWMDRIRHNAYISDCILH